MMSDLGAYLLAMLTAKAPPAELGMGGIKGLSQAEKAGALGMGNLDLLSYGIGRYKLLGEENEKQPVIRLIVSYHTSKWQIKEYKRMSAAACALSEIVENGIHKTCNGTGRYQGKKCIGCSGTGRREWSDYYIASCIGVDQRTYKNRWKRKYIELVNSLREHEEKAKSHMVRFYSSRDY